MTTTNNDLTANADEGADSLLKRYERADLPLPDAYERWHLYGAGLENVGRDGKTETVAMGEPGPEEILVRHDACGICFSDIKIITLGPEHPRLQGRDLANEPVVMGHEVALTVVKTGANLAETFTPGQRFIVQADVFYNGANLAYGYALPGGMSQYGLVGPEVLNGDEGCYLLPIKEETGYAEAALVEPWACVEAAYHWSHRAEQKTSGEYLLVATNVKMRLEPDPEKRRTVWWSGGATPPSRSGAGFDDILFAGDTPDPDTFEKACALLAKHGQAHLNFEAPLSRPVAVDVGRIHYDFHEYVGPTENSRSELKAGGTAWFIGAAGPMGQMHVQRALGLENPPARIVGTNRDPARLEALRARFGPLAEAKGVELILFNPFDADAPEPYAFAPDGYDDIVLMVPDAGLIEQAFPLLAPDGVLNVFAGVARGVTATIDVSDIVTKNVRIVGTTGSTIADMRQTRDLMEAGRLDTGASLAAVGGLPAFRDGLEAVKSGRFPGKTVIFPQIMDLPLTALPDLATVRPDVFALLRDGRYWTDEAEAELIKEALATQTEAEVAE